MEISRRLSLFALKNCRLERAEPVYRTVPGWGEDTVGILEFEELPQAARDYVSLVEEEVGAEIGLVSTGPRREETIIRPQGELSRLIGARLEEILAQRLSG